MKAGPEIDGSVCLGLNVTSELCSLASFCLVYFICQTGVIVIVFMPHNVVCFTQVRTCKALRRDIEESTNVSFFFNF